MQRIKILDSLRGIAASLVVFHHLYTRFSYLFAANEPAALHKVLNFISELNVEAVMFFFILSGFSIRLSLRNGLPVTKELFNEYVYRRLKRIMPLYYVAIVFTIVAGFITKAIYTNGDFSIKNLLGNVFFLQCSKSYKGNWFAPYGDNGPLWSLSFEMFYYFFFPLFILLLLKFFKTFTERTNRIALTVAALFSFVCMIINNKFFFPFIAFSALYYIWYCGFYLADLYLQKRLLLNKNFMVPVVLLLITGGMLYLKSSAGFYKLVFASALSVAFFIAYALRQKYYSFFVACFDKPLNFLFYQIGKGSYALYLLHYPLILILMYCPQVTLLLVAAAMIAMIVLCIWLEQFFVKKKWLFLKLRYIR